MDCKKKWYKRTYLQNRNRVTDVENTSVVSRGRVGGEGINWKIEVDVHTPVYEIEN